MARCSGIQNSVSNNETSTEAFYTKTGAESRFSRNAAMRHARPSQVQQ
jgi:hypothetical protein